MMSVLLAAALGLLVSSGAWFMSERVQIRLRSAQISKISPYVLPVAPKIAGGGGGGGDHDKLDSPKAKYQGTVVISRSLGMGLDEKALAAVRQWKFEPALKDGRPVPVQINVEVNFRLY
jgi:hypothetical protein